VCGNTGTLGFARSPQRQPTLAKFYINFRYRDRVSTNDQGIDLPNLAAAVDVAIQSVIVGRPEILDELNASRGGRITASRTSWLKQLVYMWVAAAVVLMVSIGGTAAQPKSGETAARPKKILFLHTFGPNFEQGAAWSREIQKEPTVALAAGHSRTFPRHGSGGRQRC
jgi:hypothetical protein